MSTHPTVGQPPHGFLAPQVALPIPSTPLDAAARERAARVVLAIQRQQTPEEVMLGVDHDTIDTAMRDDLELAEAQDFADILAAVLVPR